MRKKEGEEKREGGEERKVRRIRTREKVERKAR